MGKTRKRKSKKKQQRFTRKQYNDGNGMLTSVWGPPLWHFLTCMSFNYPTKPTALQKKQYKQFIISLQHILPCIYCRDNLKKNLKCVPLRKIDLKNRDKFSKWMFRLHEQVNKMLGKKSGLTYCQVRDRYEHFRSRCNKRKKTRKKTEKGCVDARPGSMKSKCVIKIVPQKTKCKTFQIDKKCMSK